MMKTTFVTMFALGTWPLISTAMPTKAELDKVSPVVADLMRPEQEALKAGKKSKSEVAAAALELVAKADGEAAKLLLTKGAYNLYVRDGDFDKAIATLKSFREIVPDMEPQYLANIIESSLRTISRKNGGQLYRLLDETRTIARYRGEQKQLEAQAKTTPTDKSLQLKLAEHYAVLNDWAKAIDAFVLSSDRKASDVARMEKANAKTLRVAADFWWNYPARKAPEFEKPFRQHAAKLYEQAIASGELVGLNKVQADRRIEEAKALGETAFQNMKEKVFSCREDKLYCVIDLSGGWNVNRYPVSYLNAVPKGGWTDEYKTTKLVLRRIGPGSFVRGGAVLRIDHPFYLGVFEITQMQYKLVCGNNPVQQKNALHPVRNVSYDMIRGTSAGAQWPATNSVDEASFLGKLRMRTELDCDLPTEAQWEYACRAGTTTAFSFGDNPNGAYMWYCDNSEKTVHAVGRQSPNEWGLYDMHGNVWEWCLDWYGGSADGDPDLSGAYVGSYRINRGGNYAARANACTSSKRNWSSPSCINSGIGFRLAIQPSFLLQKLPQEKVVAEKSKCNIAGKLILAKREMEEKISAQREDKLYCVIDLSGGPNAKRYPVSYLNSAPKTGWTDEYKTTKLVLRRIKPGSFEYLPGKKFTISKTFYISVFELTQRQYQLVCGINPSCYKGDMRPVEQISFDVFRGTSGDYGWPLSADVGKESFLGLIRMKTNILFDLPTEVQWEYACRAGTDTKYNNGGNDLSDMFNVGKCFENGGTNDHHCVVGSFQPNHWGLYDMQGNVWEWCLDRSNNSWGIEDWTRDLKESETDPKGPVLGKERILRGGSFLHAADNCLPWIRHTCESTKSFYHFGFRLAIQSPFIQTTTCLNADQSKAKREMEEKIAAQREDRLYCVIDLSGGPNAKRYPVSYLDRAPKTGWSDEYKTTKLVLRKINPGKFKMGGSYVVKLTKPYYMGVFEVTQRQWELVTGTNTSHFKGNDLCPVEQVSYEMLRGKHVGAGWPQNNDVDAISFMGKLQQRTHIQLDLPTEAQWEYACCAGFCTPPLNGDHAWFKGNAAGRTHPVGIKMPNEWGLYDMNGNVWEWCLDWHGQLSGTFDPRGSTSGRNRVARGGSWSDVESLCTSSIRGNIYPSYQSINYGFRLSIRLK